MRKLKVISTIFSLTFALVTAASVSQATTLRAFVSSTGNDANAATNCQQSAPCRTFAGAYPTVTAGGELIALDTAGYGPLTGGNTINKAITIATVPGAIAFVVVATGTAGFTVSAGSTDQVILRNISFNGSGAASTTGLLHNTGKLFVKDCFFTQLSVGVSTFAKMDLVSSDLVNNGIAVQATGDGADAGGPCPACYVAGQTAIKIVGGNINHNGTALVTVNPGIGSGATTKTNIWLYQVAGGSNATLTQFADNVTFMSGSGTGCGSCTNPSVYSGPNNPR